MRNQEEVDGFSFRSEQIIVKFQKEETFERITSEIDRYDVKYVNEYIFVLVNCIRRYCIENNACQVKNVSQKGHLAASSNFDWQGANQ